MQLPSYVTVTLSSIASLYTYMYARTYARSHIRTLTHSHTHRHTHTHTHIHTHAHIHTRTHKHTHTHTLMNINVIKCVDQGKQFYLDLIGRTLPPAPALVHPSYPLSQSQSRSLATTPQKDIGRDTSSTSRAMLR